MSDIKLFRTTSSGVGQLTGSSVALEKSLQNLKEANLDALLAVRFLAKTYSTGPKYGGHVDSLGIDENGCPVTIQYQRSAKAEPLIQHKGIPIDDEGNILAYKAVNRNYTDCYTGTVDNSVGAENEMPRNKISDDPNIGCHHGYHVGAIDYARHFGPPSRRIIICKVDPKDVVCIPKDSSFQKMRVCRYKVIGNYGGDMPSTTVKSEDMDRSEPPKAPAGAKTPKKSAKPKKTRAVSADANPSLWKSYDKMDLFALKDVPIGPLRTYASRHLKISGASKIPGGKIMLIQAILEVRQP